VLVQVGKVYFVRDGHHRISVARALGQLDIEAEVTIWQVSGPLPWETRVGLAAASVADQATRGTEARSGGCVASILATLVHPRQGFDPGPLECSGLVSPKQVLLCSSVAHRASPISGH
jgi:hypothetical protein